MFHDTSERKTVLSNIGQMSETVNGKVSKVIQLKKNAEEVASLWGNYFK